MATWRDELRRLVATVKEDELLDLVAELRRAEVEVEIRARSMDRGNGPPKAYTAQQVAEMLNRDVSWVRRHGNRLAAVKADGAVLYPETGIRRFLEGRQ